MDRATLAAYDKEAAAFAQDWHEQPAPVDLHAIVTCFFIRGGTTADIGCGSGREVAWLNANGYPVKYGTGVAAVQEVYEQAAVKPQPVHA